MKLYEETPFFLLGRKSAVAACMVLCVILKLLVPPGQIVRRWTVRIGRVVVKVGRVDDALHLGQDRRRKGTVPEALPVEPVEPPKRSYFFKSVIFKFSKKKKVSLVLLNFADATALVAEPLRRVVPAQLLDEGARVPGDVARELDRVDALQDDVVRAHRVGAGERRGA